MYDLDKCVGYFSEAIIFTSSVVDDTRTVLDHAQSLFLDDGPARACSWRNAASKPFSRSTCFCHRE